MSYMTAIYPVRQFRMPASLIADFTRSLPVGFNGGGLTLSMVFPSIRGTTIYAGHYCTVQDPLVGGSAAVAVYDTGNANGLYIESQGYASTDSSNPTHPVSTPTGMFINMNKQSGSSAEYNTSYAGYGVQVFDYTSLGGSVPLYVSNRVGGSSPLALFENAGNGNAYVKIKSGSTANREVGIQIAAKDGTVMWTIGKLGDSGSNLLQILDTVNSRQMMTITSGVSSIPTFPLGIKLIQSTTGGGSALFGTNCPATTLTHPYTWFTMITSDGSTVYVPAFK